MFELFHYFNFQLHLSLIGISKFIPKLPGGGGQEKSNGGKSPLTPLPRLNPVYTEHKTAALCEFNQIGLLHRKFKMRQL